MYTDEFWFGDEDDVFAFDIVGRKKRTHMAKISVPTRRAMPASRFAAPLKSEPVKVNAPKAGSVKSADGIAHNPLFTTRGQNKSC
jgi:hypothetical protein